MCEKCKKLLADPKVLINIEDTDSLLPFVDAALPIFVRSQEKLMEIGFEAGTPIHPVTTAAVLGWLYYATMLNAAQEKDITEEEFLSFDATLFNNVKKGVEIAGKNLSSFTVVPLSELPDDIKTLVKDIINGTIH